MSEAENIRKERLRGSIVLNFRRSCIVFELVTMSGHSRFGPFSELKTVVGQIVICHT